VHSRCSDDIICIYIHKHTHVYMCIFMIKYEHTYVCICLHKHIWVHLLTMQFMRPPNAVCTTDAAIIFYVYTYTHIYTHTYLHIWIYVYWCKNKYIYIYTYWCAYEHMHVYKYTHWPCSPWDNRTYSDDIVCINKQIHAYVKIYMHSFTYLNMYVFIYTHIYIYIYM